MKRLHENPWTRRLLKTSNRSMHQVVSLLMCSIILLSGLCTGASKCFAVPGTVKVHQKISDTFNFTGTLEDSDNFGRSVASLGDLDGDGIVDLAVGAQNDDDGGTNRGAVWILFMSSNGSVRAHQKISATEGDFIGGLGDDDFFGSSVTALGDVDCDGVVDLAVGAVLDDDGGTNRGAVYILFLRPNGTVKNWQKISDTFGGFDGILSNSDNFGWSVASLGDIDNDGVVDLAVSARRDDDGGTNRGAIWILFLQPDGTVKANQKISDTFGNFTGALNDQDEFGSSVAALGDVNGDGTTDLAVGARLDDDGGNDRGAVWVLFLQSDGTVQSQQKISDTEGNFVTGVLDNADNFGASVASVGDLDDDGVCDLAVGAWTDDDGGTNRGAVWVLFLNADGTVKSGLTRKISDTEGNFLGDLDNSDLFGTSVASLGDVDGDGIVDLAVGARDDDDGGTNRGALWVLFLDGSLLSHAPLPSACPANIAGAPGDIVRISVCLTPRVGAPPFPIDAFGAELQFDSTQLEYVDTERTTATQNWAGLSGSEVSAGRVMVGGFHTVPIATMGRISLADVVLRVRTGATGSSPLTLSGFVDDLAGSPDAAGVFRACPTTCTPGIARVTTEDVRATTGTVNVFVRLEDLGAGSVVQVFTMQLVYPRRLLCFLGATPVDLTANWIPANSGQLGARENAEGVITLSGGTATAADYITGPQSGALAQLTFQVIDNCDEGEIGRFLPFALADGLSGVKVCCGSFSCQEVKGDVNGSGLPLTAADALCAYNIAMSGGVAPPLPPFADPSCISAEAADWNCDGTVTAVDAMGIFDFAMGTSLVTDPNCCPAFPGDLACPKTLVMPWGDAEKGLLAANLYRLEFEHQTHDNELIAVPLVMAALQGSGAFMFDLHFDPLKSDYVSLELAPQGQRWEALGAMEVAPGHLRVGGFTWKGLDLSESEASKTTVGSVEIAQLLLRTQEDRFDALQVNWQEQVLGWDRGIEPIDDYLATRISLGRPYPNPMRGDVSVSLVVPAGASRSVKVSVYDVQGRLVQQVLQAVLPSGIHRARWDRRDKSGRLVGAGIYLFRLKAGDEVMHRKVVVLQ